MAEIWTMLHHGVAYFYSTHSPTTDALVTSIGVPLAVRTAIDGIGYCLRPVVQSAGNCYYGSKRWVKDRLAVPDRCLTGPAYLCCLEGYVTRKLREKRRAAQPAPSLESRALVVGKPVWSSSAGCFVLYEHETSVPLKLVPNTVTSGGEIVYSVIHPQQQTKSSDGDEKRVKKVEVEPAWTPENIKSTFRANLVIIVDDRPYGVGWRSNQDSFTTPFHMGPL